MSWHFLERWVEKANQHSTLVGKIWITFLIVCRMVIVASVGDRVYNDEQSEFKCNTLQPGCTNVCFNSFSPISHLRFWSFQILFVATPSVVFVIYSAHKTKMKKTNRRQRLSNDDDDDGTTDKLRSREKVSHLKSMSSRSKSHASRFHDKNKSEIISKEVAKTGRSRNRRLRGSISHHQQLNDEFMLEQEKLSSDNDKKHTYKRRRINSGGGLPKSTIIRLPQMNRGRHDTDRGRRGWSAYFERSGSCSSNTSGVGSIDNNNRHAKRNSATKKNFNSNNNNNDAKDNDNTIVWREPTQSKPQAGDGPNAGRPLTDLIVWNAAITKDVAPHQKDDKTVDEQDQATDKSSLQNYPRRHCCISNKDHDNSLEDHVCRSLTAAPPEYPGTIKENEHPVSPFKISPDANADDRKGPPNHTDMVAAQPVMSNTKHTMNEIKIRNRNNPAFENHFRWYFASVFLRLAMEVGFVVLQVVLFGLTVPEFYKCQRWPCPNVVDCFISRPKEKTYFLWFMLLYSCLCVVLNLSEVLYLIYSYIRKLSKDREEKKLTMNSEKQPKTQFWRRDHSGNLVPCYNLHQQPGGLHPEEIDMDDRLGGLHSGISVPSRFGLATKVWSRGSRPGRSENSTQAERLGSGREFMALMMDSDEDRDEILEMELEQQELAQMDDILDVGGGDMMDETEDIGGGGDGDCAI